MFFISACVIFMIIHPARLVDICGSPNFDVADSAFQRRITATSSASKFYIFRVTPFVIAHNDYFCRQLTNPSLTLNSLNLSSNDIPRRTSFRKIIIRNNRQTFNKKPIFTSKLALEETNLSTVLTAAKHYVS